jgi:hypothetical protein
MVGKEKRNSDYVRNIPLIKEKYHLNKQLTREVAESISLLCLAPQLSAGSPILLITLMKIEICSNFEVHGPIPTFSLTYTGDMT